MKKHSIALAVAATLSAPAMAQNVSLYGTVDVGYSNSTIQNAVGNEAGGVATGATVKVSSWGSNRSCTDGALTSNRFGIQGSEDLGGGLTARFNYEVGLDFAAGASGFGGTARQAFVALDSKTAGTVSLGRQYSPIFSAGAAFDAGSANNMAGRTVYGKHTLVNASPVSASNTAQNTATTTRINNSVMYTSPSMNGVSASVMYGKDKTDTTGVGTGTSNVGGRLIFSQGNLNVQVATHRFEDLAADAATTYKSSANLAGASYNLGWATVMGMYLTNKTEAQGAQVQGYKGTQLGIRAPLTAAVTSFATWGNGQVDSTGGNKTHEGTGYQAGVSYALSKRTNTYVAYGREEFERMSNGTTFISKELAAGIRHSF